MEGWLKREELLFTETAVERLKKAHVAVLGIGGVGGYAVEALVRSGIGRLTLIDGDEVSFTNLNRQIIATTETIGRKKVDVMQERILAINPKAQVQAYHCFFLPGTEAEFLPFSRYDYVVDAIDTVSAKLELAVQAQREGFPLISCMGTGNKLDPMAFQVADIYETGVCPLARVMRRELKKRNVKALKVVYSREEVKAPQKTMTEGGKRAVPGSVSFVPPAAGLLLAGEVIKDLIQASLL